MCESKECCVSNECCTLNLYDVEFASIKGYSGRAVVLATFDEEAKALVKKQLEEGGRETTMSDVYDIVEIDLKKEIRINESKSILMGVI